MNCFTGSPTENRQETIERFASGSAGSHGENCMGMRVTARVFAGTHLTCEAFFLALWTLHQQLATKS